MNFQSTFPITLSASWQTPQIDALSSYLQRWLLDPTSLTARLKQHCHQFEIVLLGQQIQPCPSDETFANIKQGEQVLVREVLLYCDEKPQVFARSILPLSSLTGAEQALANLGTQSLGQVLFNSPSLKRHRIEIASFDKHSTVGQLSQNLHLEYQDVLWGRRSVFVVEDKPLMVAEVFLPQSFAYSKKEKLDKNHA